MLTPTDILVHSLNTGKTMINRFTADLTPAEYLHRPCGGANCAAWQIGHLVMSERSALGRLGVPADRLPALPDGFDKRFARDENAPKLEDYGDTSVLLPLFNAHRDLTIETVKAMPADKIAAPLEKPHPLFGTVAEMLNFMGAVHPTMHAGQITLIRRSLGRPPIV